MQLRQLPNALLVLAYSGTTRYNRQTCYQTQTDLRNNHTLSADDSVIYRTASDGQLRSNLTNPELTYEGCMAICGTMMGWYDDRLPRLLTWLIPLILLVACMQYGDIGAKTYYLIPVLFGDPISSFNSLISTVELSNRCRIYASEILERFERQERFRELRVLVAPELATIISAFVEVRAKVRASNRSQEVDFDAVQALWAVLDGAFPPNTPNPASVSHSRADLFKNVYKKLNRGRSNKKVGAILSLAFYIFQVIIAFFPNLAGTTAPSGGRIGPTMLLSFILAMVPLSILIGSPGSYEDIQDELSRFMEKLGISTADQPAMCERIGSRCRFIQRKTGGAQTDFHKSLAWSGGISIYRPDISPKMLQRLFCSKSSPVNSLDVVERGRQGAFPKLFVVTSQERQRGLRPKMRTQLPIAALPVILAFLTAIVIHQQPPESFSCRSLLACGVLAVWTISWLVTEAIVASDFATGFHQWRIILAKNFLAALLVLGFIIANSCGLLNDCWCASGVLTRGLSKAYIALNPRKLFDLNDLERYPAIVTVAFSLQFSFPIFIAYAIGKSGFREMAGLPSIGSLTRRKK